MNVVHTSRFRQQSGIALVLVLAFILLLAGLLTAFFSRSVSDRQVSSSSLGQTQADVFAKGAGELVVGDLQTQIADGSLLTTYGQQHLYLPDSKKTLQLQNVVPYRSLLNDRLGNGDASSPLGGKEYVNLVQRSTYNQTTYENSLGHVFNRACGSSTLDPAIGGRFVSPERWNRPMLLERQDPNSPTDLTPRSFTDPRYVLGNTVGPGKSAAPDWVLVTAKGGNGQDLLQVNSNNQISGPDPVVGRFAYQIYDEGGLLDINVAGGAPNAFDAPMEPKRQTGKQQPSLLGSSSNKSSLAFADLRQIPGLDSGTVGNETIDTLASFRSYASLQQTDPFSQTLKKMTFSYDSLWNYYTLQVVNAGNSLQANYNTLGSKNQSDHQFASRQDLIRFFTFGLAYADDKKRAPLTTSLQYLGTFTRGIDQPSFIPSQSRGHVLSDQQGGNVEAYQKDDDINPSLLTVRVKAGNAGKSTFTRNDGSLAFPDEPLVIKRFALSRLSWLTYQGPSGKSKTAPGRVRTKIPTDSKDLDIKSLKVEFGVAQSFLDQGTAENIQKYFGLRWNTAGYWTYDVHLGGTGIMTLQQVAGANREPNFFELLKATIHAGALGKWAVKDPSHLSQYQRDHSVDCQIVQIGANIIDQADIDGFPTRIHFAPTDTSYEGPKEFYGVENLPYLYRMRNAAFRVGDDVLPMPKDRNQQKQTDPITIKKEGTAIFMQEPEVWNPHNYYAAPSTNPTISQSLTGDRSMGIPRPDYLRLSAYMGTPGNRRDPQSSSLFVYSRVRQPSGDEYSSPRTIAFTEENTQVDFTNTPIPYREPRLLIKSNQNTQPKPDVNKQWQDVAFTITAPGLKKALMADKIAAKALSSAIPNAEKGITVKGTPPQFETKEPGTNSSYIGIYLGTGPILWKSETPGQTNVAGSLFVSTSNTPSASTTPPEVTYQLLYKDTNNVYQPYDVKWCVLQNETSEPDLEGKGGPFTLLSDNFYPQQMLGWSRYNVAFDPRTSRFGFQSAIVGEPGDGGNEFAPLRKSGTSQVKYYWVDFNDRIEPGTMRPDSSAGFGWTIKTLSGGGASTGGTTPIEWPKWTYDANTLRPGLFAQNVKTASDGMRFNRDSAKSTTAQYYADPDGVVRRGCAAYLGVGEVAGQPMASSFYGTNLLRNRESRPIILNRPFRSVAELGGVFSDTPWKNLDFSTSESGYAALLDAFCINESDDASAMVAGKVDLNTHQAPVLKAVLVNAYRDEYSVALDKSSRAQKLTDIEASTIASQVIARNASSNVLPGQGPVANISELVGRIKPDGTYTGLVDDFTNSEPTLKNIPRYREAPLRALASVGNTRVWNLMIDVIAQTGRYPQGTTDLSKFVIGGEQRYWMHVAIDRLTNQVIDKQIEVVKE